MTKTLTHTEAMEKVKAITEGKITLEELFQLYEVISAVNMGGYNEAREQYTKMFAPQVAKVIWATENV